jgi:tetratricopeptide (TPR) repeat protein
LVPPKQRDFINKYLSGRTIVLHNLSTTVSIQIKNFLASMGAKQGGIVESHQVNAFQDVYKTNPKVMLVVEEEAEPEKWTELITAVKDIELETRPAVLFVMDKYKKSTIVKLGQDEIEGVVTKPLNQMKITGQFINTIKSWHTKRKYLRFIYEGRELLEQDQFDRAEKAFVASIEHHPKPALSYQLIGDVLYQKGDSKKALESYFKALDINQSHFPSLKSLFNLFKNAGFSSEAYKIVKKIFSYYPAGDEELCDALRLAIQTTSYTDIEKLHEIYIEMDNKSESLRRHMASALYVLSKHYMNTDRIEEAYRIGHLIRHLKVDTKRYFFNLIKRVRKISTKDQVIRFMTLFLAEDHNTNEYIMCNFYVSLFDVSMVSDHIQTGLDFIDRGIEDVELYEETIRLLEHVGSDKKAMVLRQKADKIWPGEGFYRPDDN